VVVVAAVLLASTRGNWGDCRGMDVGMMAVEMVIEDLLSERIETRVAFDVFLDWGEKNVGVDYSR
jgi:hypothetical protein